MIEGRQECYRHLGCSLGTVVFRKNAKWIAASLIVQRISVLRQRGSDRALFSSRVNLTNDSGMSGEQSGSPSQHLTAVTFNIHQKQTGKIVTIYKIVQDHNGDFHCSRTEGTLTAVLRECGSRCSCPHRCFDQSYIGKTAHITPQKAEISGRRLKCVNVAY